MGKGNVPIPNDSVGVVEELTYDGKVIVKFDDAVREDVCIFALREVRLASAAAAAAAGRGGGNPVAEPAAMAPPPPAATAMAAPPAAAPATKTSSGRSGGKRSAEQRAKKRPHVHARSKKGAVTVLGAAELEKVKKAAFDEGVGVGVARGAAQLKALSFTPRPHFCAT